MRSKTLMLFAARAFVAALVIAVPLSAQSQTLTPFDPTGSTSTNPASINAAGTITGFYSDASFLNHGFLRAADGTITTFDAPGAAQGTFAQNINPAGTITGYYMDAGSVNHGFVRAIDGTITTFDAPGAGTAQFQGTTVSSINPGGEITGNYADATFATHGFLRAVDGSFTKFDVGSQGTFPTSINPGGRSQETIYSNWAPRDNSYRAVSCALVTAPSPPTLIRRTRFQAFLELSTRMERLRDTTRTTSAAHGISSCAVKAGPSPRLIFRGRDKFSLRLSIRERRLRELTLTPAS